ncbi:hypothetical protein ACFPAF_16555 [Hymenobacter endophyticus]|uniref:Terminase small subunit n=1 Tax=Hymenobacter endophyticus TaxID=3076335 RepID=A0ABU3TKW8_9BACT|nr:hypothetical protein [Hymenobacter endophyticus]MDU0372016.1 hypothetical protein [Hymenobacter endophyticus]
MKKLETTRWYIAGSQEGFPSGSLAQEVYRDYRTVRDVAEMVMNLVDADDDIDQQVTQELKKMGYSLHMKVAKGRAVKTEITTPNRLIRILENGGARRGETHGQPGGDESEGWLEAHVFDSSAGDDDLTANEPDKYVLPPEQQE